MSGYQILLPLPDDERADLKADILRRGIQIPILVDECGNIIDGHHRKQIADELGIDCPVARREGLTDAEKRELAVALNIWRRHLTREQRQDIIDKLLLAAPETSDREIAKATGTDHKTVGSRRKQKEARGEIPHVENRIDSRGRQQPATRPTTSVKTRPAESKKPHPAVQPAKVHRAFEAAAIDARRLLAKNNGEATVNDARYLAPRAASVLGKCLPYLSENERVALLDKYGLRDRIAAAAEESEVGPGTADAEEQSSQAWTGGPKPEASHESDATTAEAAQPRPLHAHGPYQQSEEADDAQA